MTDYVRAKATRWVEHDWPGWIEVQVVEQEGTTAIFVDKLPVFDDGRITPGVQLPIDLEVPCEVRRWHTDHGVRRWAVISLLGRPGGLEDQAGRTEFRVPADEIITRP